MTSEGSSDATTGGADPAQISECGRTIGGGVVVFDVTWDGTLEGDTVAWVVTIDDEAASERVVLCRERTRDDVRQFVASEGRQQEVPVDATEEDGHLTARFPEEVVGVAATWPVWKALLVIDGTAVSEQVVPTT